MDNQFTNLEMQLIRSSLATKTDAEIAELLERPEQQVRKIINEITGGQAEARDRDVSLYAEEQQKRSVKRQRVTAEKKQKKESVQLRQDDERKRRAEAESRWHAQREYARKRENSRTYKTRQLQLDKCISVKLDDKTYAMVERQKTEKETRDLIKQVVHNYNLQKRKRLLIKDND